MVDNQIEHSYWDTLSLMEDNRVNPSFFQKLLSAFLVMETKHNAKKILKNYNVVYSFLGHSVYKYRTLLGYLDPIMLSIIAKQIIVFINKRSIMTQVGTF